VHKQGAKWVMRISVSVAFSPTPTRSTFAGSAILVIVNSSQFTGLSGAGG